MGMMEHETGYFSSSGLSASMARNLTRMAGLMLLSALGCSSGMDEGSSAGSGGSGGQGGSGGEGGSGGQGGSAGEKTVLRVPLYPYIPDAAGDQLVAMALRIEAEFEAAHSGIDLVVNPPCFEGDFYDPASLAEGLAAEDADCSYDVIETDMSLLGELVATGAIRPWEELPPADWHPAGVAASTYNGEIYGVPHWLCGHFTFSRDTSVESADTAAELASALVDLQTDAPDMAGNLLGSWNLPALYLDAWADTNGPDGVVSAISTTMYDVATLDALSTFSGTCESGGSNPCLDGTYDLEENFDLPAQQFAAGEVDATFGYSERLHAIVKNLPPDGDPAEIKISSAPLGDGNHPLLFTDSFVVSGRCTDACAEAAAAFVAYMSSASTFAWILASEDAPQETRVPRYLLAATLDAYGAPTISEEPFYQALNALTQEGMSFPNGGLLDVRNEMRDDILATLTSAP
ncbi:extracellular solute-binding protein [Sorangium sp. So ce429]